MRGAEASQLFPKAVAVEMEELVHSTDSFFRRMTMTLFFGRDAFPFLLMVLFIVLLNCLVIYLNRVGKRMPSMEEGLLLCFQHNLISLF